MTRIPSPTFDRVGQRNRFTARPAIVRRVDQPVAGVVRVTLGGPAFHDFVSTGPADHVRLFFPDEAGVLHAPVAVGAADDGIVRPEAPTINRDYTPLNQRSSGDETTIDVDFMVHDHAGPATRWALAASPGDEIVVVGPRGSKAAPQAIDGFLAIVDATALPSVSRWIAEIPSGTRVTVIAAVDHDASWLGDYLGTDESAELHLVPSDAEGAAYLAALASAGPIDETTFVFAAGEATALTEVRRHLRDLGLPPEQYAVSGYWRRGVAAFDHHTPLDD